LNLTGGVGVTPDAAFFLAKYLRENPNMKLFHQLLREFSCDPEHQVDDNDMRELRTQLNTVWHKLGIDIKFTNHFVDRINDHRNGKQITVCELARLFMEAFKQHSKEISHITKKEWEAVLSDIKTNVNVPFVLKHNGNHVELVAKTVMRKAGFSPNSQGEKKLTVSHYEPKGTPMNEKKTFRQIREWVGFNTPEVAPVAAVQSIDNVDNPAIYVEDPENLDMLNAYCHQINSQQFINPYYPIHTLWRKLSIIGLNFDLNSVMFIGNQGVQSIPLTQYGGRYGVLNHDHVVGSDDGISHRLPGGLNLEIRFQKNNGVYSLDAQIVRAAQDGPFGEQIDVEDAQIVAEANLAGDIAKDESGKLVSHINGVKKNIRTTMFLVKSAKQDGRSTASHESDLAKQTALLKKLESKLALAKRSKAGGTPNLPESEA